MRIAYLGQMADVSGENGISKKIRTQATHWMSAGHEVRYYSLASTAKVWSGLQPLSAEVLPRGGPITRAFQSHRLARRIRAWRPDIIYYRYAHHSPGLPSLFRGIPTVAEINSDDITEYPLTLSRAKQLYHRLTRRRVLDAVAGVVAVTRELGVRFQAPGLPQTVIGNAITLSEFSPAPLPVGDALPRLVFVGSPGTPWHGLDRLAEIAELRPDATIDVIGYSAQDWNGASPPPRAIRFHGHLPRAAYEPLIAGATAALGTLALFRKRMDEGCSIKIREYLALGLPVIIAHDDTDIPPDAEYFLRLPNTPASFAPEAKRFNAFLDRWRGRRVPRSAISHLDTSVKERERLEFLARVAAVRGGRS